MSLAISSLQELPDADQDRLAEAILGLIGSLDQGRHLSADQAEEVRRRRRDLEGNPAALASDHDMTELWASCGL